MSAAAELLANALVDHLSRDEPVVWAVPVEPDEDVRSGGVYFEVDGPDETTLVVTVVEVHR